MPAVLPAVPRPEAFATAARSRAPITGTAPVGTAVRALRVVVEVGAGTGPSVSEVLQEIFDVAHDRLDVGDVRIEQATSPTRPAAPAGLEIDARTRLLAVDGRPVHLTYLEFELLHFLLQEPNRVFTRQEILSRVWGNPQADGSRAVDVRMARLRRKLGRFGVALVAVRRVGYRWSPDRLIDAGAGSPEDAGVQVQW